MNRTPVLTRRGPIPRLVSFRSVVVATLVVVACFNILGEAAAVQAAAAPAQTRLAKLTALKAGAAWLQSQQGANGGFPDLKGEIDPGVTAETVMTLVALRNVGVKVETDRAIAYLKKDAPGDVARVAGGDAKVVMALASSGANPRDATGVDLVARVIASWHEATGSYGKQQLDNVLALMALSVTGEKIPDRAIKMLAAKQLDDGSWSFGGSPDPGSGDSTMTAFVVQALVVTGHKDDKMVAKAIQYFHGIQSQDGGFGVAAGAPADTNSTGFIVSALTAAGEKPKSKDWRNAVGALLAFQPGDDMLATIAAVFALSGAAYPILPAK